MKALRYFQQAIEQEIEAFKEQELFDVVCAAFGATSDAFEKAVNLGINNFVSVGYGLVS